MKNKERKLKIEKYLKRLVKHLGVDYTPDAVGFPDVFSEVRKDGIVDVTLSFIYKPSKKSKK